MPEEQKIIVDVAAGTGTAAAYLDMAPNVVAIITGVYFCLRIWETKTVRKLTGRECCGFSARLCVVRLFGGQARRAKGYGVL